MRWRRFADNPTSSGVPTGTWAPVGATVSRTARMSINATRGTGRARSRTVLARMSNSFDRESAAVDPQLTALRKASAVGTVARHVEGGRDRVRPKGTATGRSNRTHRHRRDATRPGLFFAQQSPYSLLSSPKYRTRSEILPFRKVKCPNRWTRRHLAERIRGTVRQHRVRDGSCSRRVRWRARL